MLWKKLIEQQVDADPMWKGLSVHRGWGQYLYNKNAIQMSCTMTLYEQHKFYKELYAKICIDKEVRFFLFLASRNQKSLKIKLKILFSDFRF
jgi:hypothetical protein